MKSQCVSIVVPPPMAAPWTAATTGLSKLTNALMRLACGDSPGPGGFLRKSSISLPAQNESPAPCQSTTRVLSSFAALLKMPARATYIADVIAFRFVGRLNWTRRTLPACSVTISSMVEFPVRLVNFTASPGSGRLPPPRRCRRFPFAHDLFGKPLHTFPDHALGRVFPRFRNGSAGTQAIDFSCAEAELPQ